MLRQMDTHTSPLLQANELTLTYTSTTAVDGLSLKLERGEVLGLLGLNGAGKTSTLRMLSGVMAPSTGDVLIDGISLQEQPLLAKKKIGYLPEIAPLYADMRVRDYLHYAGRLRGMRGTVLNEQLDTLLHKLHLDSFARRRIGNLSKGYKQRVGLAQALIHDPALLILDEPSSGLDPEQMREMRELIRSLSPDKGVLFSSHLLSEVTELCDRVSVLHQGKLVYQGQLDTARQTTGRFIVRFANSVDTDRLTKLPAIDEADIVAPDTWALTAVDGHDLALLPALVSADFPILEFAPERPSLDTLFSSLVNTEIAPAAHQWETL